jgi:hypothetical protein
VIRGLVGDTHLFGVFAQLHADRITQNHPEHNKYDF